MSVTQLQKCTPSQYYVELKYHAKLDKRGQNCKARELKVIRDRLISPHLCLKDKLVQSLDISTT